MGLTDTEKEEVGGGIGGSVLLIIVGVVIVLYCWRRARTGYVVRFFLRRRPRNVENIINQYTERQKYPR